MIKFAIIGTGMMAGKMMEAFELLPDLKVIAVQGSSLERAKAFASRFGISRHYAALDPILDDDDIDAVYVANATENHFGTVMAALQKKKSVLCEKPISVSPEESRLIEDEAMRGNVLCMESMWTHCLPAYQQFFSLNQTLEFGRATQLYADFGYPVDPILQPRVFEKTDGSGVLLDRGVYPVALAIGLFGNVKSVVAQVHYTDAGVDTHANLLLTHEDAQQTVLSVSFDVLLQNRALLSCTKGAISLEPPVIGSEKLVVHSFQSSNSLVSVPSDGFKTYIRRKLKQSSMLRRMNSMKSAGAAENFPFGANQYLPVLKHFVDLMRAGSKQSPLLPLSHSTEVLRVLDLAKKQNNQTTY